MNFNKHLELEGKHAFLSASKHSWINYTDEKLITAFKNHLAVQRGTDLHELAKRCILLGIKLPRTDNTLNMYVNDAIGYKMTPEQPLYFSPNAFGTADAICFRKNALRIHDLKTGDTPTSMDQLKIYAALFCLEYDIKPKDIFIELRIYQNNTVLIFQPQVDDIVPVMDKIITFDNIINKIKEDND